MAAASFSLTRNGTPLIEMELLNATMVTHPEVFDVSETQEYGLEIDNREPDTMYRVKIGDVLAETCGDSGPNTPRPRGSRLEWYDARFFEGSHGYVQARLFSRTEDEADWKERAVLNFLVQSSKLTSARYDSMFEQLRMLAANIVFDLVSKTLRSLSFDRGSKTPFVRTSLLELRVIQRLWPSLATCINLIDSQAAKTLRREYSMKRCYGGELLDARALQSMARVGVNPLKGRLNSFTANVSQLVESTNVPENQMIKGFLVFLLGRIQDCQTAIRQQISGIEQGFVWRSRDDEESLFEIEDKPRIQKLRAYEQASINTMRQIREALSLRFLEGVDSRLEILTSPVIRNVAPYRALVQLMLDYLSTGILILDDSQEERIKSTHRLYEQWVFLQIVSAIQRLGLHCISQEGLLNRSKTFRFTLDFDRGARVLFRAGDDKYLSVRYEPWVLPQDVALNSGESVFRAGNDRIAWSPDILIELITEEEANQSNALCSFAIVIDAKYSSRIQDHHWESVGKYHQIRATQSGRQVGRQLWLVYPGQAHDDDDFPISMRDSSVSWTESGPDCPPDENVEGTVLLRPATSVVFDTESQNWIGRPEPAAVELVDGLLSYLGIEHKRPQD